jgi:hypothetical protein
VLHSYPFIISTRHVVSFDGDNGDDEGGVAAAIELCVVGVAVE